MKIKRSETHQAQSLTMQSPVPISHEDDDDDDDDDDDMQPPHPLDLFLGTKKRYTSTTVADTDEEVRLLSTAHM